MNLNHSKMKNSILFARPIAFCWATQLTYHNIETQKEVEKASNIVSKIQHIADMVYFYSTFPNEVQWNLGMLNTKSTRVVWKCVKFYWILEPKPTVPYNKNQKFQIAAVGRTSQSLLTMGNKFCHRGIQSIQTQLISPKEGKGKAVKEGQVHCSSNISGNVLKNRNLHLFQ